MNFLASLSVLAACTLAASLSCGQFIDISLSIKIVLNPADGTRPSGVSDGDIDTMIGGMNDLMAGYLRGLRFRRVDPVRNVGGLGDLTGPSRYYNVDFLRESATRAEMEEDAMASPVLYRWNPSAVNLYVNGATGGGYCAFPSEELIVVGGGSIRNFRLVLHEIGHYFDLYHTQGRTCSCCDDCGSPGNDEIDDTLPDWPCWDADGIANNAFGRPYRSLTPVQQRNVDDVFHNIMSYHNGGCTDATSTTLERLTEQQLDRWTDTMAVRRRHVISGITRFVDGNSVCAFPNGRSRCELVGGPFRTIRDSLASPSATGADIMIIRAGNYPEHFTLNRPITLRATRNGPVTLGR